MNDESTLSTLIKMASRRFEADLSSLSPTDDFFVRLGINSYQAMELLTDIEVPDYELQGVTTFAALAQVIDRRR